MISCFRRRGMIPERKSTAKIRSSIEIHHLNLGNSSRALGCTRLSENMNWEPARPMLPFFPPRQGWIYFSVNKVEIGVSAAPVTLNVSRQTSAVGSRFRSDRRADSHNRRTRKKPLAPSIFPISARNTLDRISGDSEAGPCGRSNESSRIRMLTRSMMLKPFDEIENGMAMVGRFDLKRCRRLNPNFPHPALLSLQAHKPDCQSGFGRDQENTLDEADLESGNRGPTKVVKRFQPFSPSRNFQPPITFSIITYYSP